MDSAEMARRRWQDVSSKDRSTLARGAAFARWAHATESDLAKARARAANAREARNKILAARLLGLDVSKLADLNVKFVSPSEFRSQKSQEQADYWKRLRQEKNSTPAAYVDQSPARRAPIVHPASFRLAAGPEHGKRS
jgi:hypothetical protein